MYHVYELAGAGRMAVLSDDDLVQLSAVQRARYRLRTGGLRTGLEAVVRMVELERRRRMGGEADHAVVISR